MTTRKSSPKAKAAPSLAKVTKTAEARAVECAFPWVIAAVIFAAGAGAHALWGGRLPDQSLVAVAFVLISGGLAAFTYRVAAPRAPIIRATATLSVVLTGTALVILLVFGVTAATSTAYWLPAVGLASAWTVVNLPAIRGTGDDGPRGGLDEALNLHGVKAKILHDDEDRRVIRMTLPRGTKGFKDVQKVTDELGNLADLPPGSVRVQSGDADRGRVAEVTLTKKDPLRGVLNWPGPGPLGAGPYEPVPFGVYQDGALATFVPIKHTIIMGASGGGKSVTCRVILAELARRREMVIWLADPSKGRQTVGPVADGIDWLVENAPGAKAMLDATLRIAKVRAQWLAERELMDWEPGCGLPLLVVWFEEAAAVLNDLSKFVEATEQVRSSGIRLVASLQRASADRIQTSARSNFGQAMCFGVLDDYSAGFVLTDSTIDAGACPQAWKTSRPGCAYWESGAAGPDGAVDFERWPVPLRGFFPSNEALRAAVEEGAAVRDGLHEIDQAAAGPIYADRKRTTVAATAVRVVNLDEEPEVWDDDDEDRDVEWPLPEVDPDMDAGDAALMTDVDFARGPIGAYDGPDVVFPQPEGPVLTAEEARVQFSEMLAGYMEETGSATITLREISDRWRWRKRQWIHRQLDALIAANQVSRDEDQAGVYHLHLLVTVGESQ